jgi:hypothetical protein
MTAAPAPAGARPRYRKLPGHLRLLFGGASFWVAGDHFLLVRSSRFAERYKRFYFGDIQGIAVAEARRFHVSTRAIGAAIVWLLVVALTSRWPVVRDAIAWCGLLFPLGWLLVSLLGSCRCRIYTAVSNDELPSVYRRWTARRFLAAVEPIIAAQQGAVPADWAEIADQTGAAPAPGPAVAPGPVGSPRTIASDLLILSLFLGAALELAHIPAAAQRWAILVTALSIFSATVAVMVHRNKGLIKRSMQLLAIITLISMVLMMYGRVMVAAGMAGYEAGKTKSAVTLQPDFSESSSMRPFTAGLYGLLGIIGLALSFSSQRSEQTKLVE